MKGTRNLTLSLAALGAASILLAPAADAQVRVGVQIGGGYRRPYNRAPQSRDWVVRPLVDRAERQSNAFRDWFEGKYSHRRLGRDEDGRDLKHDIQRLDEAMERLRSRADDHRPGIGRGELQDAIRWGVEIDREIGRDRDTRFTYREWDDLRDTLNDLARLYDVRGI